MSDKMWEENTPESKDHGANMGPTWVLSAPGGPHVAPWTLLSGTDLFPNKFYNECNYWSMLSLKFIRVNKKSQWWNFVTGRTGSCHKQWLVAWPVPSRCLKQWRYIVNWTLRNKLQWNLEWNSYNFIQESAFKNVGWRIAVILLRPQYVKDTAQNVTGEASQIGERPDNSNLISRRRQTDWSQVVTQEIIVVTLMGV